MTTKRYCVAFGKSSQPSLLKPMKRLHLKLYWTVFKSNTKTYQIDDNFIVPNFERLDSLYPGRNVKTSYRSLGAWANTWTQNWFPFFITLMTIFPNIFFQALVWPWFDIKVVKSPSIYLPRYALEPLLVLKLQENE